MISKCKDLFYFFRWGALAFLIAFMSGLGIFSVVVQRYQSQIFLQKSFIHLQENLNMNGYDLAYENLHIGGFFQLLKADNFQIYKKEKNDFISWKIEHLQINAGLFTPEKICFNLSAAQKIQIQNKEFDILPQAALLTLEFEQNKLNNVILEIEALNIKKFADIQNIRFGGRRTMPQAIHAGAPFFDMYLRLNDIKLNGLLDYPSGQNIRTVFLDAVLMGEIPQNEVFTTSLNQWLQSGGYINIQRLVLDWQPFMLVGRGDLNFNEAFSPILHLYTSSKGGLEFLDQLQEKNFIDPKGAFVAKILLENKAFKMVPDDTLRSVVTPIDWRDGKVAVENITIYKN